MEQIYSKGSLEILPDSSRQNSKIFDLYKFFDWNFRFKNFEFQKTKNRKNEELEQETLIKVKALDCLVSMLKCMVEWSRELYTDPHINGQMSHMGKEYRYVTYGMKIVCLLSGF